MTGFLVIGKGKQDLVDTEYQPAARVLGADIGDETGPTGTPRRSQASKGGYSPNRNDTLDAVDSLGHPWMLHTGSLEGAELGRGKKSTGGLHIEQQMGGIPMYDLAHD